MKTKDQILAAIHNGKKAECLDRRDFSRLADFFPVEQWGLFGFALVDGADAPKPTPLTKENVLKNLGHDIEFGFEKALGKRGISASFMNDVVKMWLWVLDDDLQDNNQYAQYGLPLLKAVALKYGFENRIGDDIGNEKKYSAYTD